MPYKACCHGWELKRDILPQVLKVSVIDNPVSAS